MIIGLFICTAVTALFIGFYVYRNPEKVISFQKRFYLLINWRMEPVSMAKEIRNTKWMGIFLIIVTLICCIYYWLQ